MSSPNIVRAIRTKIQKQLLPSVPSRWQKQFDFGLQAYGLKAFQSAAGNARMTAEKPRTGIRKSERLFQNLGLADALGSAFDSLGLVKPSSFVNVDHSDMNGLTALVGAVQTRNGRAIPCFVETTYSDRLPSHQNAAPRKKALRAARAKERQLQSFTGHTIDALQDFADRLGFWPRLVFDRGFGNESIVEHLSSAGATFYIRLKSGRYIELDGNRLQIQHLKDKDAIIQLYGLTLRVIRSPRDGKNDEPWYILTNDTNMSRNKVVQIYYHRFEIEETFKDMKHIFELKRTRLNKPLSLKFLLWFVSLGIALLYLVTRPKQARSCAGETEHQTKTHPKKQTSWLRQAYEQLQQASGLLLWGGV